MVDKNVKRLLRAIIDQELVPPGLEVVQCSGCDDLIFIPNNNPTQQAYWLGLILDQECRWTETRHCQGKYKKIDFSLADAKRIMASKK